MRKELMAAFVLIFISMTVISCSTVRVPDSDPTLPEATIVMSRLSEINEVALEEVVINDDSNIVIIAHGHDPDGGIKNISLVGDIAIRCDNPDNGFFEAAAETFFTQNLDPNFPPVPERAKKLRTVIFNVTPEVIAQWKSSCTEDFVFTRLIAQFFAVAVNFDGGVHDTDFVKIHMPAP
ncbi:MAG: hypothetical protein DHS20C13_07400 [Thermodesulfobacteriota bacterium]|nr:MAG: hypothetical protein DHS20C13_07400 [Thermodesulfobacteriota bacterium]